VLFRHFRGVRAASEEENVDLVQGIARTPWQRSDGSRSLVVAVSPLLQCHSEVALLLLTSAAGLHSCREAGEVSQKQCRLFFFGPPIAEYWESRFIPIGLWGDASELRKLRQACRAEAQWGMFILSPAGLNPAR
jgi:hypothetical protein